MSLEQLKLIRQQRAKRVYIEVQRAREIYEQAIRDLQDARNEVENYKIWRIRQQKVLFEKLQEGEFTADKLGSYNTTVERMKEQEQRLTATLPEYEEKYKQAQKVLELSREQLKNVNKDKEKVDEFIDMQAKEEKVIQERKEENEVDELSCFKSSQQAAE